MVNKSLKTKDGINISVKCSDKVERHTSFFKYKVVSAESGIVKFKIENSPRVTAGSDGYSLVEISVADDKNYYIATSASPEVCDNTRLYVHGSNAEKDSVILSLPIREFNIFQLGMLVWNISIMEHMGKLVYNICTICNSIASKTLPFNKVATEFALDTHTCCEIPTIIQINVVTHGDLNRQNTSNPVRLIAPSWWILKGRVHSGGASLGSLLSHMDSSLSSSQKADVVVQHVCKACHKVKSPECVPYPLWKTEAPFDLCEECLSRFVTCSNCARVGLNFAVWGDGHICNSCITHAQCYLCYIENERTPETACVIMNRGGSRYRLCQEHHTIITRDGWAATKLLPELNYSFKIPAQDLQVIYDHTGDLIHTDSALKVVSKMPVCALEWEYPFSTIATNTHVRDRAIWLFDNAQKEAGHADLFMAKHDGSLPSFATEFVSNMPKTLKIWHKLYFDGVLDKLASYIDRDYVKAHKAKIGGHIHISRASFTPTQVAKVMKFLYSNVKFLNFICDRDVDGSAAGYYSAATNVNPLAFAYNKAQVSPEKYTIARVTHNIHDKIDMGTIEVRAFKAPISGMEVISNVEFMFAMREFVRDISGKDSDKADAFVSYVAENTKLYPVLQEKILNRNVKKFALNVPAVPKASTVRRRAFGTEARHTCTSCHTTFTATPSHPVLFSNTAATLCSACGFICGRCGTVELMSYRYSLPGSPIHICESCYDNAVVECGHCGNDTPNISTTSAWNDDNEISICESCRDTHYTYCDNCDTYHLSTEECGC